MFKKTLLTVALSAGLLGAGAANAYTTTTADYPGSTRFFTVDSTEMFFSANTYVADGDNDNTLPSVPSTTDYFIKAGLVNINGPEDVGPNWHSLGNFVVTGNGQTSGKFTITDYASTWGSYEKIALALKVGNGRFDPDWVVIGLEDYAHSGYWSVTEEQSLSHALLFGYNDKGGRKPPSEVPVPAAAWLMLTGLIGFLGLGRKKA